MSKRITSRPILHYQKSWGSHTRVYHYVLTELIKGKSIEDSVKIKEDFESTHTYILVCDTGDLCTEPQNILEMYHLEKSEGYTGFIKGLVKAYPYEIEDYSDDGDEYKFSDDLIIEKLNQGLNLKKNWNSWYEAYGVLLKELCEGKSTEDNIRLKEELDDTQTCLFIKEMGEQAPPVSVLKKMYEDEMGDGIFNAIYDFLNYCFYDVE